MILFSPAMKAAVASEVTTLCYCWKMTRKDGVVSGFTDHDCTLTVDGVLCKPNSGFTAKEAETALGLAIGNSEIEGALDDAEITAADLSAGLYDGASIGLYLVNWRTPAEFALLRTAYIARIEQADGVWRAELEGDAADFTAKHGRLYRKGCDAQLGDALCAVNLNVPAYSGAGAIGIVRSATEFEVTGLAGFGSGWFNDGVIQWTSGAANGRLAKVLVHIKAGVLVALTLREEPRFPILAGETFSIQAGCDKSFGTCKEKFANSLNFRGFPHMPGNDQAYAYAREGMNFDGGPVVQ
jgi:uncharacterized phage protein (TIGR02218 family)